MGKGEVAIRRVLSLKLVEEFRRRSNVTEFHDAL